jgi:hypothetical protein
MKCPQAPETRILLSANKGLLPFYRRSVPRRGVHNPADQDFSTHSFNL